MGHTLRMLAYISIAIVLGYALISIMPNQGVNLLRSKLNHAGTLSEEEPQVTTPFKGLKWGIWALIWLLDLVVALFVYLFVKNRFYSS